MTMKNFLLFPLLFPMLLFAASDKSVQEKFYDDNISYKQFLDLGKCSCLDNLIVNKKFDLFDSHFRTLNALNSLIPYFYRKIDIKKVVSDYQDRKINYVIKKYKLKDEYFNKNRSPFFICNKIFSSDNETKKLYKDFIYNKEFFIDNKEYENLYSSYFGDPNRTYE